MTDLIEPMDVVDAVERYIYTELSDAVKYESRHPLDEPGIDLLHALGARIYGQGWRDGVRTADARARGQRERDTDRGRR